MARVMIEGIEQQMLVPIPDSTGFDQMLFLGIDPKKCNGCEECIQHCPTGAIYGEAGLTHNIPYAAPCLHCGMCLTHCPSRAIYETFSWLDEVKEKLADEKSIVVAMPAPSIRYALAETFDHGKRANAARKMITALKSLGFTHCWDVEFAADVTIWEEGSEFAARLREGGTLPMFSSCCSSWQRYAETFYPDLLPHFSSVKSPVAINGRLAKTYGAAKYGYDPASIYTVAITPCLSKKHETLRPELQFNGLRDIDACLETRELIHFMREAGVDFATLPPGGYDSLMGESSGGGTLFGVTGGVAESILRYASQKLSGESPESWDFSEIRGTESVRECSVSLDGREVRVAAVHGGKAFARICDVVRAGKSPYDFIEFMACPGGCLSGGGQPLFLEER